MSITKPLLALLTVAIVSAPVFAQESEEELEARMREAEMQLAAQEAAEAAREMAAASQLASEEAEVRMYEAERRLAEAARQVADLSMAQLPRMERLERMIRAGRGPVLGIMISPGSEQPVEGVEILAVTPGGAAEEAGLLSGDVITSVNGEPLTAESGMAANEKLLDFMSGVEEGDELEVEFLRGSDADKVTLKPRPASNVYAFSFDGRDFKMPEAGVAPQMKQFENFVWMSHDDGFGDMELVALTERLGSYFGASEGLLVVRAPDNEELKLEDGDVILNIDGRTPKSVSHAMRILGSYQAGESLEIEIMRDKRKRTIEIEIPDNRQSQFRPSAFPLAPEGPRRNVVIEKDRT